MPWTNPFMAQSARWSGKLAVPPKTKLQMAVASRPLAMKVLGLLRSETAPMMNLPSP